MKTYKSHHNIRSQTLIEANKMPGVKLWPNPVGLGYLGTVVSEYQEGKDNFIVLKNPRRMKFGLAKGSSDCIGFKSVELSGYNIPRFCALEIKAGTDRLKPQQKNYQNMILESGGIAGVVRSPADITRIMSLPIITGRD
jgi:hypothetical protein